MILADRLGSLGLQLPAAPLMPPSVVTTFSWIRVVGHRVLISGHGPLSADGSPAGPFGRVPDQVSVEEAQESARLAAASVLADVERAVGDLEQVAAWLSVSGYVQAQPGYPGTTAVINAFSEVVHAVFGPAIGDHARTAVGVAALPLNLPLVVSGELLLTSPLPAR